MTSGLLFTKKVEAATIYVNSTSGNDTTGNGSESTPYKTFHKGHTMAASSGDTLNLTGTFTWTDADETGDAANSGYTINKSITIQGQGADSTFVQAASAERTADRRVFTIGTSKNVTIQNLTIRYGYSTTYNGGVGVYTTYDSNLNLSNCIIEKNHRSYNDGDGRYSGGAVQAYSLSTGNVTIDNCQIQHNSDLGGNSNAGAGVHISLANSNSGKVTITNSTINNNESTQGSAIFGYYPRMIVTNTTISHNVGNYTVYPLSFSGNYLAYAYFTNVTIAYNTVGTYGYGLYTWGMADGSLTPKGFMIKNSIIAQNKRTNGDQYDYYYYSASSLTNNGYNLVETQSGSGSHFTNGVNGCIVGVQANLNLSNSLALNNSTRITSTLALSEGSPAINAGSATANGAVSVPTTDQRGGGRDGATDIGAYEYNASGIITTTPTTQASNITFSSVNYSQMTINWTNGDGVKRVVLMKQADSGTTSPTDSTTYTANTIFGSGTEIATSSGWFTVYNGTGTSVTITNLTPSTNYRVQVFEYNGGTGNEMYFTETNTDNPNTQATIAFLAPTSQATNITFSSVNNSQMTVGWTNGNGEKRAVFMKQADSGTTSPTDSNTYTANTVFGSGTEIATSSGWFTVYNGTGTSVTVTGLTQSTNYRVQVFEYNGAAGSEKYFTDTATNNPNTQSTTATPTGDDFETGSFSTNPWTFGGNANWTITSADKYAGTYSARAGVITHSQTSYMQVVAIVGAGNITFYKKVSSESGYDFLKFYIDGVLQNSSWSGTVVWSQNSYTVTAGSHTFKWTYSKDGSVSSGSDTAWVDNIVFPTAADSTAPTITSVSSDKTNGSYKAGEIIDIDVTFSEAVTSTGNVTVTLDTGRTCTFTVSNATTGTCNYTVQAGDTSADLNATISGTIADQANNAMSNFTPTTSLVTNKNLVIDTTAPATPLVSPAADTYTSTQSATLSSAGSSAIYYTTNGTTPTTGSTLYSGAITIGSSLTLKALAVDTAGNESSIMTAAYVINIDSTPPTITSVSSDKTNGLYKAGEIIDIDVTFSEAVTSTGNVTVTLETGGTDRTCTFTVTNSTTGTCNYTVQAGDTSTDLDATISGAIADQAGNSMINFTPATSLAANKALAIDTTSPSTPTASPVAGIYTAVQSVILSSSDSNAIYYTTNGDEPTTSSTLYSLTIAVNNSLTIKALGVDAAGNQSSVLTAVYVINLDPDAPIITAVSAAPTSNSTTVTWATDEDSSSQIEFGLTSSYGSLTSETDTSSRVSSHSVTVNSLKSCVRYYYRVKSKDATDNQGISNQYTFHTSGCTSSSISNGNEASVATSGGSLSLTNGQSTATVTVPNNYTSENAVIQINKLNSSSAPTAPTGTSLVKDNFYDLVAVSNSNTVISSFDQPVSFVITYGTDTESAYDENTLDVYKYSNSAWTKQNCTLDNVANTLACSLNGFSTYGVFGQAISSSGSSSSSSGSSSSGSSSVPTCNDSSPNGTPDLFQIDATKNTATLYFTSVKPISEYVIKYGIGDRTDQYSGTFKTNQTEGVISITISSLTPNTDYTFSVRGGNGCATGNWSNAKTAKTITKLNKNIEIEKAITDRSPPKYCGYTIKPNDTLWNIAQNNLGDGSLYEKIVKLNINTYPDINSLLKIGMNLTLPCKEKLIHPKNNINIQILNQGIPLPKVKIEFNQSSYSAQTDKNGIASFSDIEKGEYTLKLLYGNYETKQKLLINSSKDQNFVLGIAIKNDLISKWILTLIAVIIGLFYLYVRIPIRKRRMLIRKIYKTIVKVFQIIIIKLNSCHSIPVRKRKIFVRKVKLIIIKGFQKLFK